MAIRGYVAQGSVGLAQLKTLLTAIDGAFVPPYPTEDTTHRCAINGKPSNPSSGPEWTEDPDFPGNWPASDTTDASCGYVLYEVDQDVLDAIGAGSVTIPSGVTLQYCGEEYGFGA